jgi:hypothetical protein
MDIEITKADFLNHSGTNLDKVIRGSDTENAVLIIIATAKRRVEDAINMTSVQTYDETLYSDSQKTGIKNAVLDYLEYMIETGDLYATGGYNVDGTQMPAFPFYIISNLRAIGVVTSSFGRRHNVNLF